MGIFSAPGKNWMSVGSDAETACGGRIARGLTGSLRCSPGRGNLGRRLRVRPLLDSSSPPQDPKTRRRWPSLEIIFSWSFNFGAGLFIGSGGGQTQTREG